MLCAIDKTTRQDNTMIVVSGEALMDVFAAGSTATGLMLDARIGGSPLERGHRPGAAGAAGGVFWRGVHRLSG
jgi:hypothetical protein